jgi:hypothetical protein
VALLRTVVLSQTIVHTPTQDGVEPLQQLSQKVLQEPIRAPIMHFSIAVRMRYSLRSYSAEVLVQLLSITSYMAAPIWEL